MPQGVGAELAVSDTVDPPSESLQRVVADFPDPMLYTDEERKLMADAVQPNMRSANISPKPFQAIIDDFFLPEDLHGHVLDIGPGQCDFLDLARRAGANPTTGIDFDPAICALGRLRGHAMYEANLQKGWPADLPRMDGVFCRGSINVYWFASDPRRLDAFLDGLGAIIAGARWVWIAPWNKPGAGLPEPDPVAPRVDRWCRELSLERLETYPADQARYGIGYTIPRIEIWTRGLQRRADAGPA